MGAIGAFKSHYHKLDRSTLHLKLRSIKQAWDTVSNPALLNICRNCGVIGEEFLESLRSRFLKQVIGLAPQELMIVGDYYDAWRCGLIDVAGAYRLRGVAFEDPQHLDGDDLDGEYWAQYGVTR